MNVVKTKKNNKEYLYVQKSVRVDGKVKTFSKCLGPTDTPEGITKKDIEFNKKLLKEKIERYKQIFSPLENILSEAQKKDLERIKKEHQIRQKPLTNLQKLKLIQRLGMQFTYDSNAIEGSTITEEDVVRILKDQVSPEGKALIEIKETQNHMRAFDTIAEEEYEKITKKLIRDIHKIMSKELLGPHQEGKFRKIPVKIMGSTTETTKPENIHSEINGLLRWYGKARKKLHLIEAIAIFHTKFEKIHPFRDYNGRTGRLLMNYMFKHEGFPLITVKYEKAKEYHKALEDGQTKNDFSLIVNMICKIFNEMYTGNTEWM